MIQLGLNLEFSRHHDLSYEAAIREAADIGYRFVEPMVHLGLNFDTGNTFLAGQSDIYEYLERFNRRLVHLHAKDISVEQGKEERGRVTGTAVGCACGDGVVEWERVASICSGCGRDIVFSVECGTIEQAARSFDHLMPILERTNNRHG